MSKPTFKQMEEFHEQTKCGRINRDNLQAFLRDPDSYLKGQAFPSQAIAKKYGFTVVEDVESSVEGKTLELVSFMETGENYVPGETMRQQAVKLKANLGLGDAKYLLDHQDMIPKKSGSKYLVFTGTLVRGADDRLHVAYLYTSGDYWYIDFCWIHDDWSGDFRLVRGK